MKRPAPVLLMSAVIFATATIASAQTDKFLDINLSLFSPRYGGSGAYVSHQTGVAHYSTAYQTQTYSTAYAAPTVYPTYQAPVMAQTYQASAYQTAYPTYQAPVYQASMYQTAYPTYQAPVYQPVAYPAYSQTTISTPAPTHVSYSYASYHRPRYHRRSHLLEFNAHLAPAPCWNPLFSLHLGLF